MALTPPLFRRKFPLLVTSSLLAMGGAPFLQAAEQFNCKASATGGWSCMQKTASSTLPPRPSHGEAGAQAQQVVTEQVSESKGKALASRSADYSHIDWVPREKLTKEQLEEIPPYCAGTYVEPKRPGMNDRTPQDESPTYVSARASRYEEQTQTTTLAGDVVLRQGSMQAEANEARLHQLENRGELDGNVRLRDNGALLVGDHAQLQLDNGEAQVDNAEYVMHAAKVRGSAQYAKRQEDAIIRLKNGTYTRCEPGKNTWVLRGNNIKLDPNTGFGTARNVTLRVKDVPVFYTPYMYFPIDNRRQSGFLAPSFGSTSKTGGYLVTPYYFNLAPNYDATLYPRYMATRGLMLEGEFRYMTPGSEGQLSAAWLDDQNNQRKQQSEYQSERWMYNWQHTSGLDSRLLAEVDYSDISDPYYFQDLRTDLNVSRPAYLNQRGSLTWRGDNYTAQIAAHAYVPTNVVNITPYDRLPQLTLKGSLPFQPQGLHIGYDTEFVSFQRSLHSGTYTGYNGITQAWYDTYIKGLGRAEGDRLYLAPEVNLPLEWSFGYLKPSLKYTYTRYNLSLDQQGKSTLLAEQSYNSNVDRSIPIFSVDSGLYFDRNTSWFGNSYRQTLEPRAYYLYVPNKDQSDIPVFDTLESTFSYASLWRDNRFSGKDRIGDENRLSLGLTSRLIEADGFERQTFSIGQAIYFADRKVQMPGIDYRSRNYATAQVSPYALEYLYRFNRDWKVTSAFNWDPDSRHTRSGSAMLHYQPEDNPNKVVNVGYRYRNDSVHYNQYSGTWETGGDWGDCTAGPNNCIKNYYKIQQHDFSTIWPIAQQWNVIARWQYDYNRNRTLEAFGGFEYDSCCWKLRVINRYWINYDERSLYLTQNNQANSGIFFEIILKGLGGVTGNKVDTFLSRGIQGYREREDQAYQ